MTAFGHRVRTAALLAFGALALHEARYLIAHGGPSAEGLAGAAHAYLPLAGALAAGLVALAAVELLAALSRARRAGAGAPPRPSGVRIWLAASAALLALHTGQELVEGALFAGRPGGLAVLAGGGWVCVPLALGFGALVALALRGADLAVRAAALRARARRTVRGPRRVARPAPVHLVRLRSPLAGHLAGRAPPAG